MAPTIARIRRGRTPRNRADEYEEYNYEAGIRPLLETAMGVHTLRVLQIRSSHGRLGGAET